MISRMYNSSRSSHSMRLRDFRLSKSCNQVRDHGVNFSVADSARFPDCTRAYFLMFLSANIRAGEKNTVRETTVACYASEQYLNGKQSHISDSISFLPRFFWCTRIFSICLVSKFNITLRSEFSKHALKYDHICPDTAFA